MKYKVIKNTENPEPTELIAESIIKISDAMEDIKNTKLTKRALLLLIQDNCAPVGKYPSKKVGMKEIEAVLDSVSTLKKAYIKQPVKPK